MAFELIYTSAPQGLQVGSRGFCTVACTAGMPRTYVELCESLSGYTHLYAPHQAEYTTRSPVAFSHYRVCVGGRSFQVLSRVACCGTDYTGRTNNLAYHVMAGENEQPAAGPGAVMQCPGFLLTAWTGEPRQIPGLKEMPQPAAAGFHAKHWAALTGDAGWAGLLAQKALRAPDEPLYLIYEPGLDLLALFAEMLALLPPEQRWDVTFNTYYTALPPGTTCLWRGCPTGTDALRQARRVPGAGILDLTKPLGPCAGTGPLVESARSGTTPAWTALPPARGHPPGAGSVRADSPAATPHAAAATAPVPAASTVAAPGSPSLAARRAVFAVVTGALLVVALFVVTVNLRRPPPPATGSPPAPAVAPVSPTTPPITAPPAPAPATVAAAATPSPAVQQPVPVAAPEPPAVAAPTAPETPPAATKTVLLLRTAQMARLPAAATTEPELACGARGTWDHLTAGQFQRQLRLHPLDPWRVESCELRMPNALSGFTAAVAAFALAGTQAGVTAEVRFSLARELKAGGPGLRHLVAAELAMASGDTLLLLLQPFDLPPTVVTNTEDTITLTVADLPAWQLRAVAAADWLHLDARDSDGLQRLPCTANTPETIIFTTPAVTGGETPRPAKAAARRPKSLKSQLESGASLIVYSDGQPVCRVRVPQTVSTKTEAATGTMPRK